MMVQAHCSDAILGFYVNLKTLAEHKSKLE